MTLVELGKVTESQRYKMGLDKNQYAREMCISRQTYETFLKGNRKIRAATLFLIIKFLERNGRQIPDIEMD
jgi:transcriptional regulator with XRE-family HTH domain